MQRLLPFRHLLSLTSMLRYADIAGDRRWRLQTMSGFRIFIPRHTNIIEALRANRIQTAASRSESFSEEIYPDRVAVGGGDVSSAHGESVVLQQAEPEAGRDSASLAAGDGQRGQGPVSRRDLMRGRWFVPYS
jgi:hypothetical protein